ncbi:MAG: hypothetical protein MK104_06685 [Erythrobacter sp.]|jgi:hypothetical protein|uniref:hypothetical protein n=1 Tax=Qipengyuania pacifica TaxID=2860199 RepID=UPI0035C7A0AE|nr:hypothetical protein [Erythrobacter sp.]
MTARKRKKGDFTVEKAVAIFTSATAAVGALMYALGKAYQDALLTGYGVAGSVRPSTFDVMLDAFNVWSEILTGLSAGALVFFAMLFGGNSFFGRAPTTAGLWLLAATAGTIGLFIALFLTTFQGSTDQFEASFKAKHCRPCFAYTTAQETVIGYPVLSGDDGVVIALGGSEARLLKWEDITKTRPLGARGSSEKGATQTE